jgi:microcompartment protein CcmK/EutM
MTYAAVEVGVQTVIAKLSDYTTNTNVMLGDYRALGGGQAKVVVLQRGDAAREQISMGATPTFRNDWIVVAELFLPFTGELADQKTAIDAEVDAILAELAKWPKLAGVSGVTNQEAARVREPIDSEKKWWQQDIEIRVEELETVTLSE